MNQQSRYYQDKLDYEIDSADLFTYFKRLFLVGAELASKGTPLIHLLSSSVLPSPAV